MADGCELFAIGKTDGFLGGVAQLGEHQLCTLGVIGSSPFTSTNKLSCTKFIYNLFLFALDLCRRQIRANCNQNL
jgi:hypothetical protein